MTDFKQSALYLALTAEAKDSEAILSALGSAATDFTLRSDAGQTYVHIASTSLINNDLPEVWNILLCKTNIFTRDVNGYSGLDHMIGNLPVAWSNKYLKRYLLEISADADKVEEFMKHAGMSGKTVHLKRLAVAAKADSRLLERLSMAIKIDEELLEIHKLMRVAVDKRELEMAISKRQQVVIPDLVGLPSLHVATIHGLWSTVTTLVQKFPEIINIQDNMGRTALHYATCMKGEDAEATVKLLTDAKADAAIKDVNGADVEALKANPLNMEEILGNYTTNLDRQRASEMMYRVNEAVLSGEVRSVKMALSRRELAVKEDASKLTPLHKAVILKNTSVAKWIAEQFKGAMDVQGNSGLTPMHFAAVVDKELYEALKQTGGDCHTVDVEGNDPEFYKDHSSDFILDIDALREELLITPPSRPATAASERAKSAKSAGIPEAGKTATPAAAVRAPPVMASNRQAPPPDTLDAKYIADVLGSPLTAALSEVAEKRPWDPIEYLAQWLYKHKANLNYHQQQLDAVKQAEEEELRKQEEAESRARRRREAIHLKEMEEEKKKKAEEDARKQKEQEELQKKAKESVHLSQPPELPTVTEDEETTEVIAAPVEPRMQVEKDEQGRTPLHTLVASGATVEEVEALLASSGVDMLAEKDLEGKTPRDLTDSDEMRQCFDSFVLGLLKAGDTESMVKLMENGYTPPDTLSQEDGLPEEATQMLTKAADLPKTLEKISRSVRSGNLAEVKLCVDKPSLAVSRLNSHGASAIHLAVLHEHSDVVQHLVTSFPGITACRDHQNRTALHYAYSIADEELRTSIAKILTDGEADVEAEDCKGRKPPAYQELADEMAAMKEAVVVEQAPAEVEQAPADGEAPSAEGEQAPADGEAPPAEGEQAPTEGEQAPAEGEQAPAEGEQAPAEGDAVPAEGEAAAEEPAAE